MYIQNAQQLNELLRFVWKHNLVVGVRIWMYMCVYIYIYAPTA